MYLTSSEFRQLFQCSFCVVVCHAGKCQRNQDFIGMEPWILSAQEADFQILDRDNRFGFDQFNRVVHPCQMLQRVDQQGCGGSQQVGSL